MAKIKAFFVKRKKSILRFIGSLIMLAIAATIGIMLGLKKTNDINKYINDITMRRTTTSLTMPMLLNLRVCLRVSIALSMAM